MDRCYRNPFLKKAIVRIDFTSALDISGKSLSKKASDAILKSFPIPEPKEVIAKSIELSENGAKESQTKQNHLFYYGIKREKTLCVSPFYAFLEYSTYGTFINLKEDFLILLNSIQSDFDFSINRFGLRYINQIELKDRDPLDWNPYISENLISNINFPEIRATISRCFSSIVQQFDDGMFLNFQYGIHNPDFPSRVRQSQFILDNDAYYQGVLDVDHAKSEIDLAHSRIEANFEKSIKDDLRTIMGEKIDE